MKAHSNHYDHYFQAYGMEFFYQILPWQWFKAQGIASGRGWPFAVAWINGNHLVNAWLNDQREWVWLDPQNRGKYGHKVESVDAIVI